ncbi:hypothetical protein EV426DRAFT_587898 [Tirmania nivea]|nr:hypothetical protein EV426DRAFT_587898 [Tirmania nivea]
MSFFFLFFLFFFPPKKVIHTCSLPLPLPLGMLVATLLVSCETTYCRCTYVRQSSGLVPSRKYWPYCTFLYLRKKVIWEPYDEQPQDGFKGDSRRYSVHLAHTYM